MMSPKRTLSVLLAVLIICYTLALDEDFAFDVSDDLEVEFPVETPKKLRGITDINAYVGRVFHLAIPKDSFGDSVKSYEAKIDNDSPLPSWLLFDKTGGVFWGVPLQDDIGTLHISVKAVRQSLSTNDEFTLIISENNSPSEGTDRCPSTEDSTVLTLIIDKSVKAIKPKQRIIAINNIAKFFGMPYTAFMLKPQLSPDDITDSSVVLAGPGDLRVRASKETSFIQVTVGCEGRLWLNAASIVHQLKQQARDGTISEVLRLPLIGWRVKTENRPLLREKRQDDGSGDYEEYYEYDDYDDPDNGDGAVLSSSTTTTTTTQKTMTTAKAVEHTSVDTQNILTSTVSENHPHRHHHGEIKTIDEITPDLSLIESGETTEDIPRVEESESRQLLPHTTYISAAPTTTTIITNPVPTTTPNSKESKTEKITPISGLYKPSETLESDDEYEEEYEDREDDDDDDDTITELPFINNDILHTNQERKIYLPEIEVDTETTITESSTKAKVEPVNVPPEITPTVRTTTLEILPTITVSTLTTTEETVPPITTTPTTTSTSTTTTTSRTTTTTTTTELPSSTTTPTTTTTTTTRTTTTTEKPTTMEETTTKHTTIRQIPVLTTQRMTSPHVTESVVYEVKNFPPTIQIRLNRIAVTAGKNFSQYIQEDMFVDTEDEYNLKLELLTKEGHPINPNFWCQFNPNTREIYGLPLEEDVSRWDFLLRATDTEGASVSERVEITVQQHKSWRTVNHEFTFYARVERKEDFLHPLDWALHIINGIGNVFSSTNTSKITVRSVSYATDPIIFTWANDSIPTEYCDKAEIEEMFNLLTANEDGDPSLALSRSLAPQLRAKKITQRLLGICEETPLPQPPLLPPEVPITPPVVIYPPSHHVPIQSPSNLPPILRNPVDHVNATIGELLLFRVPDDTFYDPEDVDPNNLKLQLYTADREPLSSEHWLQFDVKNKEFFGVPSSTDFRRMQYQLVCEDSGGLTASDTLIVEIHPSQKLKYNVEFSMTVEVDFETFVKNPVMKRKFVEKLQSLFKDDNVNNIHLGSFAKGSSLTKPSTIITWYNKTLVKDECPWLELKKLESILINNERSMSNHVYMTMEGDFVVIAFSIQHIGVCKIVTTPLPLPPTRAPPEIIVPIDEGAPQESNDDYLVTFIVPAVIISAMLLLAAIAACVLYRRRRSGKMNLEEDGRQSYGNKGIPVIFQEELDEKPEPGTKTPVILKDEKPPLAPPEYSKSGSLKLTGDDSEPYQPPPPFTRTQDNGRQPRPKPTPTYRKPPPYVPP